MFFFPDKSVNVNSLGDWSDRASRKRKKIGLISWNRIEIGDSSNHNSDAISNQMVYYVARFGVNQTG